MITQISPKTPIDRKIPNNNNNNNNNNNGVNKSTKIPKIKLKK